VQVVQREQPAVAAVQVVDGLVYPTKTLAPQLAEPVESINLKTV